MSSQTPHENPRHWKLGIIYHNPADPALVVPHRHGFGWTLNFGRPGAWLVVGCLTVIVAVPLVALLLARG